MAHRSTRFFFCFNRFFLGGLHVSNIGNSTTILKRNFYLSPHFSLTLKVKFSCWLTKVPTSLLLISDRRIEFLRKSSKDFPVFTKWASFLSLDFYNTLNYCWRLQDIHNMLFINTSIILSKSQTECMKNIYFLNCIYNLNSCNRKSVQICNFY